MKKRINTVATKSKDIFLEIFEVILYNIRERYIAHISKKIRNKDLVDGVAYLYDCKKFGSRYPSFLRSNELLEYILFLKFLTLFPLTRLLYFLIYCIRLLGKEPVGINKKIN